MGKPKHKKDPEFLASVYALNAGRTLDEALELSLTDIDRIDLKKWEGIGLQTYAKDKWTIHQILQHLIDWERIWCFRAILFARAEGTIPVAHNQEIMGKHSNANTLSLTHLIEELRTVRQSTILMFKSFDQQILDTNCVFFEYEMSLNAIGLTITAHQVHHFNVIEERYIPLITP